MIPAWYYMPIKHTTKKRNWQSRADISKTDNNNFYATEDLSISTPIPHISQQHAITNTNHHSITMPHNRPSTGVRYIHRNYSTYVAQCQGRLYGNRHLSWWTYVPPPPHFPAMCEPTKHVWLHKKKLGSSKQLSKNQLHKLKLSYRQSTLTFKH